MLGNSIKRKTLLGGPILPVKYFSFLNSKVNFILKYTEVIRNKDVR